MHRAVLLAPLALPLVLSVPAASLAEPPKAKPAAAAAAQTCCGGKDAACCCTESRFEKIKSLAGTWDSGDADADGKPDVTATYKVTSGGSAVIETLFPGADHEMITMYHMSGGDLIVTHYCAMGKQPRLKAKPAEGANPDPNSIEFAFMDATNLASPNDPYMGKLVMTIADTDNMTAHWWGFKDGKIDHETKFSLTRRKG